MVEISTIGELMNEKIKQKWVENLRSGKYNKGYVHLKKGDCYCVMGVLCDIAVKEGIGKWVKTEHNEFFVDCTDKDSSICLLPDVVKEWAGFTTEESYNGFVYVNYGERRSSISSLNDTKDLTFQQIADIIEGQL